MNLELNNAWAEVSTFTTNDAVKEYHVMIHAKADGTTFQQQLDAVLDTYEQLKSRQLK